MEKPWTKTAAQSKASKSKCFSKRTIRIRIRVSNSCLEWKREGVVQKERGYEGWNAR